jgi:hypothetical protein
MVFESFKGDNAIQVGKDERFGRRVREGGEVGAKVRDGGADGKREEEGGERIALSDTGGREEDVGTSLGSSEGPKKTTGVASSYAYLAALSISGQ